MKKPLGFILALFIFGSIAEGTLMIQDDFSRGSAGSPDYLDGSISAVNNLPGTPEWDSDVWVTDGFVATVTNNTFSRNAIIPVNIIDGYVYTFTVAMDLLGDVSSDSTWAGMGFYTSDLSGRNENIFSKNTAGLQFQERGAIRAYYGNSNLGYNYGYNSGGSYELTVVLDTTETQWTVDWLVNGTEIEDTYTYASNPDFRGIVIGTYNQGVEIDNLNLDLNFSSVPGVVLDHQDTVYEDGKSLPAVHISDPEILVLSNGNYLASHALAGWGSGSDSSGLTSVFRSTDQGATWRQVSSDVTGLLRASMIEHDGAVYLLGTHDDVGGGIVIAKSTDNGTTWIKSDIFSYAGMATPNNPVVFQRRIWSSAGTLSFSAPVDAANLLSTNAWMRVDGFPAVQESWPGHIIGEGQIVASPDHGLFIMPKVKYEPLTALSRIDPDTGVVAFDPNHDFVSLPGGEKKFGAAYDEISGRFFVLSNPVLPAYADSEIKPDMIRNSAAILSSTDLYNWKIEKFFLHSADFEKDGFGYMNFDFDGDDIVLVSRTAWPVGSNDPERGHDSNLLTFHRIENFRHLVPDQYLSIHDNQIRRYERTPDPRDDNLPLGEFSLGSTFSGAALSSPVALGQADNGYVYVQESGGRILCFDAAGNFLYTTNASPVALQATSLTISQPAEGICAWTASGSNDYSDPLNWYYWNRADTAEDIAVFGSAAISPVTVTIPSNSKEYLFEGDDLGEWIAENITNVIVSNGTYHATPITTNPYIYRKDQSFYGDEIPEIKICMKAAENTTVQFYWGTADTNSFSETRVVAVSYTGNGEFQTITFLPAGHVQWDGQLIKQIRFDPVNGSTAAFEIERITVKEIPTCIKGLQFHNEQSYTLSGSGYFSINADSGNGSIDVFKGNHEIQVPVKLAENTDFYAEIYSSVLFSGGLDLVGHILTVGGRGLVITNSFNMNGGTMRLDPGSKVMIDHDAIDCSGILEFVTPDDFDPGEDAVYHFIDGVEKITDQFVDIILPSLEDGLEWDTSLLYSTGNATVIAAIPSSWRTQYDVASDGSEDFIDFDGDGMDNYSEWKAGTNPTDALSYFSIRYSSSVLQTGYLLQWNSLSNRTYRVERSTNLMADPAFQIIGFGISGESGVTEFIDTNSMCLPSCYYRTVIE